MSRRNRRYSPWLLDHESALYRRQADLTRLLTVAALGVALIEALLPWESLTPGIPHWAHIALAAIALPVLYTLYHADFRRKQQAFEVVFSDVGRRLLFLDAYLEPEEYALSERIHGSHLLPLQRRIDTALKMGSGPSLHRRLDLYYRSLPTTELEGDRLGMLSVIHPGTFVAWAAALTASALALPGLGLTLGDMRGLSVLPLLALLFLFAARANTRFGYEAALYDWMRE